MNCCDLRDWGLLIDQLMETIVEGHTAGVTACDKLQTMRYVLKGSARNFRQHAQLSHFSNSFLLSVVQYQPAHAIKQYNFIVF